MIGRKTGTLANEIAIVTVYLHMKPPTQAIRAGNRTERKMETRTGRPSYATRTRRSSMRTVARTAKRKKKRNGNEMEPHVPCFIWRDCRALIVRRPSQTLYTSPKTRRKTRRAAAGLDDEN
uniref:Uncharacterized protein n=1 Tax=Cacopsylla melanoneura TaxID=428564 RepID=A0A8D8QFN6_9HEMI